MAPSSAGLDRAVAVSVAGAVVVRQPAAVPKHERWEIPPSSRVFGRLAGRSGCMRKTRRERKEAPIRVFDRFSVTRGGTFFFFARCRSSLAAAWRVLVAVVSSRRRFERKRAKCAWPVARPVLTRALGPSTLDGQMPSQKRMTTAVSQGQSLACQRRASHIKINTEQGVCYCMFKERKKGDEPFVSCVMFHVPHNSPVHSEVS